VNKDVCDVTVLYTERHSLCSESNSISSRDVRTSQWA